MINLGQRYLGSKGVPESRQEDGGLGSLASPGDREESASHHYDGEWLADVPCAGITFEVKHTELALRVNILKKRVLTHSVERYRPGPPHMTRRPSSVYA